MVEELKKIPYFGDLHYIVLQSVEGLMVQYKSSMHPLAAHVGPKIHIHNLVLDLSRISNYCKLSAMLRMGIKKIARTHSILEDHYQCSDE